MLDPRPRNFRASPGLTEAGIRTTLTRGRPGTAMKSFAGTLSLGEIGDVARFVARVFVACDQDNTRYHTAANGWPQHRARYGAAFGFATGALALDTPPDRLDPAGRAGRALFRSSCVSCHDGRLGDSPGLSLRLAGPMPEPAELAEAHHADAEADHADTDAHHDEYDTPTIHDIAPKIADPTQAERRGAALYAAACAECHAADGSGQNWIGKFLKPNPPDLRRLDPAAFDAAAFAAATLDAPEGTTMPSFAGVLSPAEATAIAAYVRRAFVGTADAAPAE